MLAPITVVLADDHEMVRESLARVLDSCQDVKVVGQIGSGEGLSQLIDELAPECLVMDYSMPDHNPVQAIKDLTDKYKDLKILVLTVHENGHYASRTLQAGAHGYLIKSAAVEELVDALKIIKQGDVYISKKISPEVWALLRRPRNQRDGLEKLSQREFDVMLMLGNGNSLQDCAQQMGVTASTVSTYRSRILEKLNLGTTSDLVRFVIENKLSGD